MKSYGRGLFEGVGFGRIHQVGMATGLGLGLNVGQGVGFGPKELAFGPTSQAFGWQQVPCTEGWNVGAAYGFQCR